MGGASSTSKIAQVLLLGLEQTGKTSFLKRIADLVKQTKEEPQLESTNGFNFISVPINNTTYDIWDLGGDSISRNFWSTFYRGINVSLVIYFIDITKKESFDQSMKELIKIINEEELKKAKIFLLFNCFLPKNTMLDEEKYNQCKEKVDELLRGLKEFPLHKIDSRIEWEILDVQKSNLNESFIEKCFKFLKK